jgi:hypothetical protein
VEHFKLSHQTSLLQVCLRIAICSAICDHGITRMCCIKCRRRR